MKRMNMKKGMALFLAMTLATSAMTACGSKDDNNEPATEIDFNDVSNGENGTEAETGETETTQTLRKRHARVCTAARLRMNGLTRA